MGVIQPPHLELTPCLAAASSCQPALGLVSSQLGAWAGKPRRNGVGRWIHSTGGRDWFGLREDSGMKTIYHELEACLTLIAHEAL